MYTETHRHLSGSISPETIWEIIKCSDRLDIAGSLNEVRQQVCLVQKNIDFDYFCTRFHILDKFIWSDQALEIMAKQVCADIKADQIEYSTLTLSLNKYAIDGDLVSAGERVFSALNKAATESNISVNYLLSVSYDWPQDLQIQTIKLIESLDKLLVGIDFVSNEFAANWEIYPTLLKPWRDRGKTVRAHVGERFGTCSNIQKAIEDLRVTRIAHGIYGASEQWVQAAKLGIVFDVSLHSNIYTNAIGLAEHPIKQMLSSGCQIALGTDDPIQFNCSLEDEYDLAEAMGLDKMMLCQMSAESRII